MNRYLTKRGRTYYLIKRIPDDVSELHPGEDTIRESLKRSALQLHRDSGLRLILEAVLFQPIG
jgi:hypothetical protein